MNFKKMKRYLRVNLLGPRPSGCETLVYIEQARNTPHIPYPVILHPPAYEDGNDSVPKRRILELRRLGITQKKTHYI